MTATTNKQVRLKSRPRGEPTPECFELTEREAPAPGEGEVLYRTIYLSLDPYMRGRMRAGRSYAEPMKKGQILCGGTVGQVVASRHERFSEDDFVLGYGGWQEYAVEPGEQLTPLDPGRGPISYALGILGMPGMTAYVGMVDVGEPETGETVLVSAAAGAVGSVAGQIARLRGCRVVGTAGTDAKCDYAVNELGFAACVNYKTTDDLLRSLMEACPDGVDVYFDNVGGDVLEAALKLVNDFARIPLIGMISQYNATEPVPGPNLMPVLVHRVKIQGMIVMDHEDRREDFLDDVSTWLAEGKMTFRQHVVDGLANAPAAFRGLFHGENFGKLLVRVSDDPTGG